MKYKTLVGFRTVFVEEWDQERARKDSRDSATFPPLVEFLKRVAEIRPSIGLSFLNCSDPAVERFAPALIPVLINTHMRAAVLDLLNGWVEENRNLAELARGLLFCEETFRDLILNVATRALDEHDYTTCFEVAHAALRHDDGSNELIEQVLAPAIDALTQADVGAFWSSYTVSESDLAKFERFPLATITSLLRNLVCSREVGYAEQMKLSRTSGTHLDEIWEMFRQRIAEAGRRSWEDRYEAVPADWHGLERRLGANLADAFTRVMRWTEDEGGADRLYKTSLLAGIYADLNADVIASLTAFVRAQGSRVTQFVSEVLCRFDGDERILTVCQAMVEVTDGGDEVGLRHIEMAILATGVVAAPFGLAEAYERKAELLLPWLAHVSSQVQDFASRLITDLDRMGIEERRRGTERLQRRKLDFDEGGET